ncbi:hypothetical protein C8R47DRAFT_1073272 [Mycena vitilis]|nr:hypothetical protein C8R47DRAFT_1073272 [Mycena vitilis]
MPPSPSAVDLAAPLPVDQGSQGNADPSVANSAPLLPLIANPAAPAASADQSDANGADTLFWGSPAVAVEAHRLNLRRPTLNDHAHRKDCANSARLQYPVDLHHGENVERGWERPPCENWSLSNPIALSTRMMPPGKHHEHLVDPDALNHWNRSPPTPARVADAECYHPIDVVLITSMHLILPLCLLNGLNICI